MKTFQFSFRELKLTSNSIETVLGYKEGEDRDLVSGLIGEIFTEAEDISNIKAQYVIFDNINFEPALRILKVNDISFGINKIIFGQIRKSESIAIFLSTAGSEIGIRSRQAMQDRDLLRGYIYDVIGSEIVEAAADLMQEDLQQTMKESGYRITNRYSPGYCGWDVAEQHSLFGLLPENYCGIRLTPSALMDPVKSASGIIGIGKDVKYNQYTCRMCNQDDCVYRRLKETRNRK
jgi:hypothetical protein